MIEYSIRSATTKDIGQLVELNAREVWSDSNWEELSQKKRWSEGLWWVDTELLNWYLKRLHHSDGGILVAEKSDGTIIGELDYCKSWDMTSKFEGFRYHIIWLLSDPEHRRMGIASQLVDHLQSISDIPIWVEAEDERTEEFYGKQGEIIHRISNWELSLDQINESMLDHRLEFSEFDISHLRDKICNYQLLIGRFYAPDYDLIQLDESHIVAEYMWGNTERASVFKFVSGETTVYAIMTQYPRIWVSPDFDMEELKPILSSIFLYIFELGFDDIYLQIYHDSGLDTFLREINFSCTIESDPVYLLHPK